MNDPGIWTEVVPNYLGGVGTILAVVVALWQTRNAKAAQYKAEIKQLKEAEINEIEKRKRQQSIVGLLDGLTESCLSHINLVKNNIEKKWEISSLDNTEYMVVPEIADYINEMKLKNSVEEYKSHLKQWVIDHKDILNDDLINKTAAKIEISGIFIDSIDLLNEKVDLYREVKRKYSESSTSINVPMEQTLKQFIRGFTLINKPNISENL